MRLLRGAPAAAPGMMWLSLLAMAAGAPLFFWLGAFAQQFSAGQCYSSAIEMIADAVEKTESPQKLAEALRALPLHGYETDCSAVKTAAGQLSRADRP